MTAMHPRLSINQVSFREEALEDFVGHCQSLGAHHVALTSPQLLEEGGLARAKKLFGGDGLQLEAIQHRFATPPNNLDADDGTANTTLVRLIRLAEQLGATSIYMSAGGRGSLDWQSAADRFCQLIAPAVAEARERGVALLVETAGIMYVDTTIAHNLVDTIALIERAGIGICLELFYCWSEGGIYELIRRAMPRCGLVQVSDYVAGDRSFPARAVPGDGAVPLAPLVASVLEAGYMGLFDIEIIGPRIDAEGHLAAAARAAEVMGSILTALGA
jgi:sugar phosphate isomerase/epimerase